MAKGLSIKFSSYGETVPKILDLIKLDQELKKHSRIILKPCLSNLESNNTSPEFLEAVLKYCIENKHPAGDILIAEGSDGQDTMEMFEHSGYRKLAEKYAIGLIDLNKAEVDPIYNSDFLKFDNIIFPVILKDSFIISLPRVAPDSETVISGSLSNMIGTFPAEYYSGFFSKGKNKIRTHPIEFSIHDILKCKMPNLAVLDSSEYGSIIAGVPFEMDKQAAKLLGESWEDIPYLKLIEESISKEEEVLI